MINKWKPSRCTCVFECTPHSRPKRPKLDLPNRLGIFATVPVCPNIHSDNNKASRMDARSYASLESSERGTDLLKAGVVRLGVDSLQDRLNIVSGGAAFTR
jgi:hypothetical protein